MIFILWNFRVSVHSLEHFQLHCGCGWKFLPLQLLFGWVLAWRTLIWGSNQLVFLSDKRDFSGIILKLLVMCELGYVQQVPLVLLKHAGLVSFVNNCCCWKSFSYVKFLSEPSWFLFNCVLCTGFCSVMQSFLSLFIFAFFQFGLKSVLLGEPWTGEACTLMNLLVVLNCSWTLLIFLSWRKPANIKQIDFASNGIIYIKIWRLRSPSVVVVCPPSLVFCLFLFL